MRTIHVDVWLPDFIQHKLDEGTRIEVEQHLAGCASCKAELETLEDAFCAIESHRADAPPPAYFASMLPRLRARIENNESRPNFAAPFVTRFALPLAAAGLAIILLLHVPFPENHQEQAPNPLRPMLEGVDSDELFGIVLEQAQQQTIVAPLDEGETNSLLAGSLLRNGDLLAGAEASDIENELTTEDDIPQILETLSDSDLEVLVARLGERIFQ